MQNQKPCEYCGGSGQVSFFKGVSRFLLSTEECPDCAGLGYQIADDSDLGAMKETEQDDPGLVERPQRRAKKGGGKDVASGKKK